MPQLLNLNLDRRGLIKFLSHTDPTHERFYNKPLDAVTLARTSKILFAVSQGPDKGKTLGDIIVEDVVLRNQAVNGTAYLDSTGGFFNNAPPARPEELPRNVFYVAFVVKPLAGKHSVPVSQIPVNVAFRIVEWQQVESKFRKGNSNCCILEACGM